MNPSSTNSPAPPAPSERPDPPARPPAGRREGVTLVTGASGYIGRQLVPALLERGHTVRVLARDPDRLAGQSWARRVQVVRGDVGSPEELRRALDDVEVAYYLVHSMDGGDDFVARDRRLAETFAQTARASGIGRIVYLSGLHPAATAAGELSEHLGSRVEVGEILLGSGVPTAVLQAGVVLGAGSASFDMLRHLTERLPVMVAPRWLESRIQPIGIADVVHFLAAAGDLPAEVNRTFDIGGPQVLTYREMIQRYAELVGLGRRRILVVPVLTPGLASHWVGAVTPVPAGVANPLVGSLIHDAVADEDDLLRMVGPPEGGLAGFDEAVRRATESIDPLRWRRTLLATSSATAACAVVGSLLTDPDSSWYRGLDKPRWQPPRQAFPVVWTALYLGIAVAASATIADLEEAGRRDDARSMRIAYGVNLALNAAWSGVFFRLHRPGLATLTAGALALSSADLTRRAGPRGTGRKAVLGAYAAWTSFATALTADLARRKAQTPPPVRPGAVRRLAQLRVGSALGRCGGAWPGS